jgi:hypothetical protein
MKDRLLRTLGLLGIALSMAAAAVVSAGLVFDDRLDTSRYGPPEYGEASATWGATAMTLVGHEVLGVETKTYSPGHAEAWGEDIGLHGVSVIAGTLTVHSLGAAPVPYGPGQGYVAGWAPYRAVNDGSVPVEVVVTRLARRQG